MDERFELVQRLEFIKQICAGKKVLHLGCTNHPYTKDSIENGMLLHFDLEKVAAELYGFDDDREGIDVLAGHGTKNLYQSNLEKLEEVAINTSFDVIVAGEIIEHLSNPGLFLEGIKRFMNQDTILAITTINAYCGLRFLLYGLRGKRGKNEPVHPDHVAYYSYSTLGLLLKRHDIKLEKFLFYDLGDEHRPHSRRIHKIINDVSVRIAPQWADGLIAVCKLDS